MKTATAISKNPFNRQKKLIAGAMFFLLLALCVFSLRWGLADIYAYQAKRHILTWQQEKTFTAQSLEQAFGWIEKARALDPSNPDYREYHANLYSRAAKLEKTSALRREKLTLALNLYLQIIDDRPTWPYAWVAIARTKAKLGEFDAFFSRSLQKAALFSGNDENVQWQIVFMGLQFWPELGLLERAKVLEVFDETLPSSRYQKRLVALAQEKNIWSNYCLRAKPTQSYLAKKCQPILKEYY